jgi:hypothetical protein
MTEDDSQEEAIGPEGMNEHYSLERRVNMLGIV